MHFLCVYTHYTEDGCYKNWNACVVTIINKGKRGFTLVVVSYTLLHKFADICLCCSAEKQGCEQW